MNYLKNVHVTPKNGDWQVKLENNQRASIITKTQQEAIDYGRKVAKDNGSELLIHGRNGQIREKNTYGRDLFPPKG